ncbi:MAG: bifunctional folylpolyglutamate synthase/dihydrofolate synthase [Dehalococcoidia bacterium]|nr:MAG: bifunctional folylpolyglutamate synthase/dihydrofolate synthase [Dehalococcoidia bacterium]
MNYQQAIDYINSYTDYEKIGMPHDPAFYDLRRVDELLSLLGDPHKKAGSVHITGTNGKGSVAVMVAAALTAAGYGTGLYTSPHLHSWRERIRVDGELISEAELAQLVADLKPYVEAVNEKATYGQLTTFEFLTCMAFAYFGQKGVKFQVLEVGMGGKFDATSVITPLVAIITTIGLDHTDVLGSTVAEIAAEKCGIIKPDIPVVISPQPPEAAQVIRQTCAERGAKLLVVGKDIKWRSLGSDLDGQQLKVEGRKGNYELSIPILGEHQLINAATAVAALEVLADGGFDIPAPKIAGGFKQLAWPGRFQVLRRNPPLVVDGAHNIDAARGLKKALKQYFDFERAILVMGASDDKNIAGVVAELVPIFDRVIVTRSRHPRAMAPAPLAAEFARHGLKALIAEDVPSALSQALAMAGKKELVCLAGSLFIVGEALEAAAKLSLNG